MVHVVSVAWVRKVRCAAMSLVLRVRSLKVCSVSFRTAFPIAVVIDPEFTRSTAGKSLSSAVLVEPKRYSSTNQNECLLSRGWRKLATAVKTFMEGSKALYYDVKEMYEIRSRHGRYLITKAAPQETAPGKVDFPLNRHQLQFSYNTRKSLIKMFPTVMLFFIPFFGYFVPLVAFMFPDKLLSHHFLSEQQKEEFALSKARQSAKAFQELLDDVQGKQQRDILTYLSKEAKHTWAHRVKGNCRVYEADPLFQECMISSTTSGESSAQSVQNLPGLTANQQILLCKGWGLRSWIPTNSRRQCLLSNHMCYLFVCDWLLAHEGGVDRLTDEQIIEACLERKIEYSADTSSVDVLKTELKAWMSLTTSFEECPVSLMARLPLNQYVKHSDD